MAEAQGWLSRENTLAPNETLAAVLEQSATLPQQMVSPLFVYREQIEEWVNQKIRATAIHGALKRNYGYTG